MYNIIPRPSVCFFKEIHPETLDKSKWNSKTRYNLPIERQGKKTEKGKLKKL